MHTCVYGSSDTLDDLLLVGKVTILVHVLHTLRYERRCDVTIPKVILLLRVG